MIAGLLVARELPLYQPRDHFENWNDAVLRTGQSLISLFLCLSVIRISRSTTFLDKFSQWGMYTLWIYVGHTYLIVIGKRVLPLLGITYDVFAALLIAALYCAIFIMIAKYFSRRRSSVTVSHEG